MLNFIHRVDRRSDERLNITVLTVLSEKERNRPENPTVLRIVEIGNNAF